MEGIFNRRYFRFKPLDTHTMSIKQPRFIQTSAFWRILDLKEKCWIHMARRILSNVEAYAGNPRRFVKGGALMELTVSFTRQSIQSLLQDTFQQCMVIFTLCLYCFVL